MSQSTDGPSAGLLTPGASHPVQERLELAEERAAYLSRVAHGLSGALHTDRAIDLVLELLVGPVVDWAQVTLVDRRHHDFRARTLDGRRLHARLPVGDLDPGSSLGRVLSHGLSDLLMVPDGEDAASASLGSAVPAPELREAVSAIRPVDLLTIALSARGATYGALTIALRGGSGFDEQAVAFIEDFAQHVGVTLDTTRALAESRRIAAVLSRGLTPPALPKLSGVELATYYRVAFEQEALGGDFYDVHGDDAGWTAVVGDVCGKGVEASVLTGKVRQAVRTAGLVDRDPARVLGLVNRVLVADGEETFVTAVCAHGRRVGDVLHVDVASAGHPEPLLVRADGSVEPVPARGTVLALLEETTYTSVHVELAEGETLLFYTDGVPEAPGRRGRFGDDRLREVLRTTGSCDARAQVESVAVALASHLGDRPHDDIAILAVQASPTG